MTAKPIPPSIRAALAERSCGICEVCHAARAVHAHHRKLKKQGGRNDLSNLLHVCTADHAAIHANPERSYALGLLVRSSFDPADIPVTIPERTVA